MLFFFEYRITRKKKDLNTTRQNVDWNFLIKNLKKQESHIFNYVGSV